MRVGLPLMKNVLTPLAKDILVPSRLTAAASAANQEKTDGLMTALIIANEKMEDIVEIVKSLEELELLIQLLGKQLKMYQKNKNVDFL